MDDPWGFAQPPADVDVKVLDLPMRPADPRWAPWPDVCLWTGVAALYAQGWRLMQTAGPLHYLLPAAWPSGHRTWLPMRSWNEYDPSNAHTAEDLDDEDHIISIAADIGLPPPPRGRIWFARSPWPRLPVSAIHTLLYVVMDQRRDQHAASYKAARTIFGWNEEQAYHALPEDVRDLIEAWADEGRTGVHANDVLEAEVEPGMLRTAIAATVLTEPQLLHWSELLNRPIDDVLVDFVTRWLAAGLPADPPLPGIDSEEKLDANTLRRLLNEE